MEELNMKISSSALMQIANAIQASVKIKQTMSNYQASLQKEAISHSQNSSDSTNQNHNRSTQIMSRQSFFDIIKTLCEYCPDEYKEQMSRAYQTANTYNSAYRKVKEKLYYRNESNPLDLSCEILRTVSPVLNIKNQATITKLIRIYDILKS